MNIQLSEHFTYRKLLRFILPSVIMMVFTSIYSVVDGIFVSNFVGKSAFASVNLIMPYLMGISALGFMIGTGGSALVSKTLGEGKEKLADQYFSMLVTITAIGGLVLSVLSFIFMRQIVVVFGASGELIGYCTLYGRISCISMTAFMLQNVFQSFFVAAGKPQLGLKVIVAAGCTNIVLDAIFIAGLHLGIAGAALATMTSEFIGGLLPVVYFLRKSNDSLLHFVKPVFDRHVFFKTCTNGSSELMTNLSMSVVNALYNLQLMKLAGENGVAAYGAVMYVNFIFVATFLGYSIGCAPVISYHYGAGNHVELRNLYKKSMSIILCWGVILFGAAQFLAPVLSGIFVGYNAELYRMTLHGFRIYAIAFLIIGINIFGSAFFTALNNGLISAVISFLRTLVFQIIMVLTLPVLFGINGIWCAISVAEFLTLIVTVTFFIRQKSRYHYL